MAVTIENKDFKKCTESIIIDTTSSIEDEFFAGLLQRARYYEQFENRKSRMTYSVSQTDFAAYF